MSSALTLAALALSAPLPAAGQVASRIAAVENGTVRFTYETKPDVEICDQGIRIGDRHMWWRSRGWDDQATRCRIGSAEIEIELRAGRVRDVEIVRSLDARTAGAVDLGTFSGPEAARYLLSLARAGADAEAAEDALFPAVIADTDELWRDLLAIARDREVDSEVRERAIFWLGQEAADAATEGLSEFARDDDEDQDIRDAAIFALSQRPHEQGLPVLMEIARTGREAETRRKAMFWLAQSGDERVLSFFEDILLGRGR